MKFLLSLLLTSNCFAAIGVFDTARQSVVGFNPTSLKAMLWLSACHTQSATNLAVVSTLQDFSGYGNSVTNTTNTACPVLKLNAINGRNCLSFDGTDDVLYSSALPNQITNPCTVFLAGSNSSSSGYWFDGYGSASTVRFILAYNTSGSNPNMEGAYAGGTDLQSTVTNNNRLLLISAVFNGAASKIYTNGVEVGSYVSSTANVGTNYLTAIKIGIRFNGQFGLNGNLCEIIVIPRVATTAEKVSMERFLGTKYGIVIP